MFLIIIQGKVKPGFELDIEIEWHAHAASNSNSIGGMVPLFFQLLKDSGFYHARIIYIEDDGNRIAHGSITGNNYPYICMILLLCDIMFVCR